jgi:hypothetical protein
LFARRVFYQCLLLINKIHYVFQDAGGKGKPEKVKKPKKPKKKHHRRRKSSSSSSSSQEGSPHRSETDRAEEVNNSVQIQNRQIKFYFKFSKLFARRVFQFKIDKLNFILNSLSCSQVVFSRMPAERKRPRSPRRPRKRTAVENRHHHRAPADQNAAVPLVMILTELKR